MHWGVFAISAEHLYLPKLPWRPPPNPRETSERINFNVINKNQLIWTVYILISDVFLKKKNVTIWLGHHSAIWTLIFYWPKIFFSGQPSFQALVQGSLCGPTLFSYLWNLSNNRWFKVSNGISNNYSWMNKKKELQLLY